MKTVKIVGLLCVILLATLAVAWQSRERPAAPPHKVVQAGRQAPAATREQGAPVPGDHDAQEPPPSLVPSEAEVQARVTPLPFDAEREKKLAADLLAYNQRTLLGAYDAVSKRDPRWDMQAREAVTLAVRYFSRADDSPTPEAVFDAAKRAIDAGCDDPLVLYLYARQSKFPNYPGVAESERRYIQAAKALEASGYPAVRRTIALSATGLALAYRSNHRDDDRPEAVRMLDAAVRLIPKALAEDGGNARGFGLLYEVALSAYLGHVAMTKDRDASFEHVDGLLDQCKEAEPLRLTLRGSYLIQSGWDARGTGLARSVTEEGWRTFESCLSEAKTTLEKAYRLRPDDFHAATLMLDVQKGIGGDRTEMEMWFERAMRAEYNNYNACAAKLDWLSPKWHGSIEDMLAFGRACRDSKRYATWIPLLLAEAHYQMGSVFQQDEMSRYMATPEVWREIQKVFDEQLRHQPQDNGLRSQYAGYCYLCGQFAEARKRFEALGKHLVPTNHFPESRLERMQRRVGLSSSIEPPAVPKISPESP